jgi:anti-sigma B factor antagonist
MEVQTGTAGSAVLVQLAGDLDSGTAVSVQDAVMPLVHQDGQQLVIDLNQVPYLSSAGLRALLLIYRQVRSVQGAVALVGIRPAVEDVLSATGFLEFFVVSDSINAAAEVLALRPGQQDGVA